MSCPFRIGQRVEFRCLTGERIFRGKVIGFLLEHYAVVDDELGLRPRIVRLDRLAHVGGLKRAA